MKTSGESFFHFLDFVSSILVAVLGLVAVPLRFFGLLTDAQIWGFTLGIVSALAILQGVRFARREAERREISTIRAAVEEVVQALKTGINIIGCPETTNAYVKLWSGYEGVYLAYNPAYRVEDFPEIRVDRKIIIEKVFAARYKNPNLKEAWYLFLTKREEDRENLQKFIDLMNEVRSHPCREIVGKLKVRELTDMSADQDSEFYLGVKHDLETAVLEPKELALTRGHGEPYSYLIATNREVNQRLRQHFWAMWKLAKPVKVF